MSGVGQAHAAKVPVVATHQVGFDELAIDQKTARCVKAKDPEALAEAILFLLAHPEEAERLSAVGYDLIKKCYTLNHTICKMEKVYRGLSIGPW